MSTEIYTLHSYFASRDEALSAARHLIKHKLAACVNIQEGITSIYRWEGAVQEAPEVLLMAKTTKNHCEAAIDAIKRLHSYDLPCIMAHPSSEGFAPYMQWVADEVGD